MKLTILYCIDCEKLVEMGNLYHIISLEDWDFCGGPFASCPPPPVDPDWNLHLTEPSDEEWKSIEKNAEELS